jgi:hypothetical protein
MTRHVHSTEEGKSSKKDVNKNLALAGIRIKAKRKKKLNSKYTSLATEQGILQQDSFFSLNQIRRISKLFQSNKILLDASRTHKPIENTHTARLIIRPTRSRTPKRLLPNHSTRAFLIIIDIPSSIPQPVRSRDQHPSLTSKDGARQSVLGRAVDQLERPVKVGVVVDVHGHDRSKDFFAHCDGFGILGEDHGGLDEEPLRVVA